MTEEKLRWRVYAACVHFAIGPEGDIAIAAAYRNGGVQTIL
jgi:hypothetical protein